jgi:hypothetical protein
MNTLEMYKQSGSQGIGLPVAAAAAAAAAAELDAVPHKNYQMNGADCNHCAFTKCTATPSDSTPTAPEDSYCAPLLL